MGRRSSAVCPLYADVGRRARLAVKLGARRGTGLRRRALPEPHVRCAEAYSATAGTASGCARGLFSGSGFGIVGGLGMQEWARLPPMSGISLSCAPGVVLGSKLRKLK